MQERAKFFLAGWPHLPKSFLTIKKRAQKKLASQPVLCYLKAWFGCLRFCYQFCLPPPKFSIGHRDGRAL
ncbi:hypothetical protein AYI70_g9982 [Smittium culicis]|uniref:Uncharacterized protein n=1 Tax=Smittium culicis TaxID=133412 RepID=A0A1R1X8L9_9FUNG|nr:hypothetical protein AYI70_g9982 [Smittium culicis]